MFPVKSTHIAQHPGIHICRSWLSWRFKTVLTQDKRFRVVRFQVEKELVIVFKVEFVDAKFGTAPEALEIDKLADKTVARPPPTAAQRQGVREKGG